MISCFWSLLVFHLEIEKRFDTANNLGLCQTNCILCIRIRLVCSLIFSKRLFNHVVIKILTMFQIKTFHILAFLSIYGQILSLSLVVFFNPIFSCSNKTCQFIDSFCLSFVYQEYFAYICIFRQKNV